MREEIVIQMEPKYINFFNRIMEGYEYLGVVTTLDKVEGVVMVRTTPDCYEEALAVIAHLNFPFAHFEETAH